MAILKFFPFDDSQVKEVEWSDMARLWRSTGVAVIGNVMNKSGEDLAVTPGTGLSVDVHNGIAWIEGIYVKLENGPYTIPITAPVSGSRTDRIILKVDWAGNKVTIEAKQGTQGSPPSLQQDNSIYEFPLAQVVVKSTDTSFASSALHDERETSTSNFVTPTCILHHSVDQKVSDGNSIGTDIILDWNTKLLDNAQMHPGSSRRRIKITEDGIYHIGVQAAWDDNSTAYGVYVRIWIDDGVNLPYPIARGAALEDGRTFMITDTSTIRPLKRGWELYVDAVDNNNNGFTRIIRSRKEYTPIFYCTKLSHYKF